MALIYLLLVLLPIAGIAYIIWDHKRKAAAREAARASRLNELLVAPPPRATEPDATAQRASAAQSPSQARSASAPAPQASVPAAPPEIQGAFYTARARVLSTPQTLLYFLLRTGLPDHVILPRVSLAALIDAGPGLSGLARDEQSRRLAALTVDFAVADRNMRPVAVIELKVSGEDGAARADREASRSRLRAAGMRYLELEPTALPRKDALRALVLEEAGAEFS